MSTDDLSLFTPEEYQHRLAGLRQLMAEHNIDAVLLTTEANHRYFTGHVTHRWTHKYVAIYALLPLDQEPVLIVPPHEALFCERDSWIKNIQVFPSAYPLQGVDAITDTIRQLDLEESRIGTELGGMFWLRMPHEDFTQLRQNLPRADFVAV